MQPKDELTPTAIRTYLYLIKAEKPVGPREVMREAKLTSPSVAYRNLQNYGNYVVKEKIGIKGYFWIGKKLIPRFFIFGFVFIMVLIIEVIILVPHLVIGSPVEGSFWLLTIITIISAIIFMTEGIKWKKNKLSL